jgi:urease accessory protein
MKYLIKGSLIGLPVLLLATAAEAHTGHGAVSGLAAGFGHPFGGLDHMLAMIAVGILGVQLGGRALWALPAVFLAMMVAGGALGVMGIALPLVEPGIAGSVVALGAVIAAGWRLPVAAAAPVVGAFAVFHGYAHGAEMAAGTSATAYGAGFVLATGLLQLAGVGLGVSLARTGRWVAAQGVRVIGAGIAFAGMVLAAV